MLLHSRVEHAHELGASVPGVRLWWASVADTSFGDASVHDAQLSAVLSPDELTRRDAFPNATRGRRFARGRALLRWLLAELTGEDAAALRFAYNPDGKPSLAGRNAPHFSLSHARDAVIIAIGGVKRLGVDVEYVHTDTRFEHIADHFFSPIEREAFRAMPTAERRAAFCRIWVRKEAYLKARGEGISQWIHATDFSVLTAKSETPTAPHSVARDQDLWLLCDIPDAPEGCVASLAIERFGAST